MDNLSYFYSETDFQKQILAVMTTNGQLTGLLQAQLHAGNQGTYLQFAIKQK